MSEQKKPFVEACLSGEALHHDIDDYIADWHDSRDSRELHEYLGMTNEEYSLWVERPEVLTTILFSKKSRLPLAEVLEHSSTAGSYALAARGLSPEEAGEVLEWLRKTGRLPR